MNIADVLVVDCEHCIKIGLCDCLTIMLLIRIMPLICRVLLSMLIPSHIALHNVKLLLC